jgi:2,3-bisphosphoglycerate-dependent phosphoglycerate mutase
VSDTIWTFLRHGQSTANLEGTLAGWRDVPLTPDGEEEAREAGVDLADIDFDEVVSSDLVRARETARLALGSWAQHTGRPIPAMVIDRDLRERTVGAWEGQPRAFLREQGQLALLASWEGQAPGGGESHKDLARRVFPALARYVGRRVLFVCHGGVMRVVVGLLDGVADEDIGKTTPMNGEIVVCLVRPDVWEKAYARALL